MVVQVSTIERVICHVFKVVVNQLKFIIMKAYDILERLLGEISDKQIWYFDDENDAERILSAKLICGKIEDSTAYLCSSQPLENEICDAIFYECGEYQFLYVIEE